MLKYAQIINEETKQCDVGLGTDIEYYKSIGMEEMEVEQAYDKQWYVKGYAPKKSDELKQDEVRKVRNHYLEIYVDPVVSNPLRWADIPEEEQQNYINYRLYLLEYTKTYNWWLTNPLTFDEWKKYKLEK